MDRLKSRLAPVLIVVGILSAALGVYALGYFLGGEKLAHGPYSGPPRGAGHSRFFKSRWQCALYSPAAKVEAIAFGLNVRLGYLSRGPESGWDSYGYYDRIGRWTSQEPR